MEDERCPKFAAHLALPRLSYSSTQRLGGFQALLLLSFLLLTALYPSQANIRYVLWAFSRYSQGDKPSSFIQPPKPPKKFRG